MATMNSKKNIRMAGLGGQGVVTAAHVLGSAAVAEGYYAVVNPFFGAEKRLAPTESYVRISNEPIYDRGEILYPNIIMVFAPEVITQGRSHTMPFYLGIQNGGLIIVNSASEIIGEKDLETLQNLNVRVVYLDATGIAVKHAQTVLATNLTMLGALCGIADESLGIALKLDDVLLATRQKFGKGGGKVVASGTSAALDEAMRKKFEKDNALLERYIDAMKTAQALTLDQLGNVTLHQFN